MRIIVCIRRGRNGEISHFEASAYESALRIPDAEVILLSMGPPSSADYLRSLTRLGAKKAILLTDPNFAGADTIATAYTLSLAVKKLCPDYVFCGRQTMEGDTGQTGIMLAEMLQFSLLTETMEIQNISQKSVSACTRTQENINLSAPAVITFEKICNLRLPSIFSKLGDVTLWSGDDIGADLSFCGLQGSPTRVVENFENQSGKRKCVFLEKDLFIPTLKKAIKETPSHDLQEKISEEKIKNVLVIGEKPIKFAKSISDDITLLQTDKEDEIAKTIQEKNPEAVLWGSDNKSKQLAGKIAAKLRLGLCADCTHLEVENGTLYLYRPALSGQVIAKIKSLTKPVMATMRTEENTKDKIVVSMGFGAKNCIDRVKTLAETIGADIASSRKAVDQGLAPYPMQVGLTGKMISPDVYIAIGISGAVQHIAGMQHAGTVIAINPDKNAPIFEYADYGFVASMEDIDFSSYS